MKKFKILASVMLVMMMVLSMMIPAMAQTVALNPADTDNASITISNASKGETYKIYKLFDATVTGTEDGSIAYTGTIPESLITYFVEDAAGNITATDSAKSADGSMSDGLKAALTEWAKTATVTNTAESDGSALTFTALAYGYYVITTTQGESAISVDSTNPNVTVYDKNSTAFSGLSKTVDDSVVDITDEVTYTVEFLTSNYNGSGATAERIVTYTIEDTLPDFLSNVTVTSIIIDADADETTTDDQTNVNAQFSEKKIVLDWYDEQNETFLYTNGAKVILTYTATVNDKVRIAEANTNTVTVTPSAGQALTDTENIYTYQFTLKKTDDKNQVLAGATFELPFYVKETPNTDGEYVYAGETAGEGLTNTLTTLNDGVITIVGVGNGIYSIEETVAPSGYNKLVDPVVVKVAENGNVTVGDDTTAVNEVVIVNQSGTELPSTGGIGTTIFYCAGAILAVGAFVLLITKKRMSREM